MSQSSHIPYRDSKLTRILQESLGGNSRTTLIINCSPCEYNEAETLSTLRFGMRAKSIKNKARINAELSPAELKKLLKKAQSDTERYQLYIGLVEQELSTWRSGGTVDQAQWASMEKALGLSPGEAAALAVKTRPAGDDGGLLQSTPANGRATPRTPLDGLRGLESRPETPSTLSLDKDEREEFLKRENELTDQLAEKESAYSAQEKRLKDVEEELALLRSRQTEVSNNNKTLATELSEAKVHVERLVYESKEAMILTDATKEQNSELANELEELRKAIADLKAQQKSSAETDKEKKKAEKLALLMANFDTGAVSEKEEHIRTTLSKLDEAVDKQTALTPADIAILRRQLLESQEAAKAHAEKVSLGAEALETVSRRKDELEQRVLALELECDQLLDRGTDGADELKAKLEAQHAARREGVQQELAEARTELESKSQELKQLALTINATKAENEELKVQSSAWI